MRRRPSCSVITKAASAASPACSPIPARRHAWRPTCTCRSPPRTKRSGGAAIGAYKRAIAVRPNFGDAYWSLANLKTYTFSDAEIAQLEAAEADPSTDALDRYHLCFALGKAHEDRAEYALSFRYYERGNALKRAASRYRAELVEQNTARQKQACTHAFFCERNGYGAASREPIFILGLPRAGSTLLEQILASHSEVEGTQELANVPRVVLDLQGSIRRLLEFCELPFEPACLDYHRTARSIRTASSEQVRQPIFREGLEQWKHFERWLGPLKEALGDALSRYRERRHESEADSRRSVPVR